MTTHTTPADPVREALAELVRVLDSPGALIDSHHGDGSYVGYSWALLQARRNAERALAQQPQAAIDAEGLAAEIYAMAQGPRPMDDAIAAIAALLARQPAQQPAASAGQEPAEYSDEWRIPVALADGRIVKMRKCDLADSDMVAFIDGRNLPPHKPASQDAQAEPSDAQMLDWLDQRGATVEILPGWSPSTWRFRVGGLHRAVGDTLRDAIRAAIKHQD